MQYYLSSIMEKHMLYIIIPLCVFFFLIVPLTTYSVYFIFKEQRDIITVMRSFNEKQVVECMKPIISDSEPDQNRIYAPDLDQKKPDKHFGMILFVFILSAIMPFFVALSGYISMNCETDIVNAFNCVNLSSSRKPILVEALASLTLSILLCVNGTGVVCDTYSSDTFNASTKHHDFYYTSTE